MVNGKFGNFDTRVGETRLFANPNFRRTDYNRGIIRADVSSCLNVRFVKGLKEIGTMLKQYIAVHKYI